MADAEDIYHWALLVGPKDEVVGGRGKRYHVKDHFIGPGQREWLFEERDITLIATNMILIRILIGKIANMSRLEAMLRGIPIRQGDPAWNCVIWVKVALEAIQADGKVLGTCQIDWLKVRDAAMRYCQEKKDQHRFDGSGNFHSDKVPTYDLLEEKETIA